MSWYKTGTVSVTNGSTTVTGTGTAFSTNSRVGDGFTGPDGNWYEITNIASETVLAIYPPYAGSTTSAATYTIAPLQGYNKESADRLRAITDSFTVVTSVAGKTGNVILLKSDVGLSNVDNTSDINKPISSSTQSALNAKEPTIPTGNYQQYVRGDKSLAYFGETVLASQLTGISFTNQTSVIATDDILVGMGKIQAQINNKASKGSNSDITSLSGLTTALSVAQGGTGGKTPAEARTSLQLGTSSTYNVGTSPGNVMEVGAGGWLGSSIISNGNANNAKATGLYSLSGAANAPFAALQLLSSDWGNDPRWQSQFALGISDNKAYFRSILKDQTSATPWVEFYHTGNTTRGSGGALSAASPIVRIADLNLSLRSDLQEETFEPAGDWGVANSEARGVVVEKLGVGAYKIKGSLGLALEGWRTHDPCSPDGGRRLGITESFEEEDGSVIIKLFKEKWLLSDDGEMTQVKGVPIDVPLNSWIDVRLHMAKNSV